MTDKEWLDRVKLAEQVYNKEFQTEEVRKFVQWLYKQYGVVYETKIDDRNQVYYWVDDESDECLSPHFDYEEDAIQWYGNVAKQILSEFGVEKGPL